MFVREVYVGLDYHQKFVQVCVLELQWPPGYRALAQAGIALSLPGRTAGGRSSGGSIGGRRKGSGGFDGSYFGGLGSSGSSGSAGGMIMMGSDGALSGGLGTCANRYICIDLARVRSGKNHLHQDLVWNKVGSSKVSPFREINSIQNRTSLGGWKNYVSATLPTPAAPTPRKSHSNVASNRLPAKK